MSAADGVLLSAYSSHPADRTKTRPACGPQLVSLHHCWTRLGDINKKNLIITFCHPWTHIHIRKKEYQPISFERPLTCYYFHSMLQCLRVCVILMNSKYALKVSSLTHNVVSVQGSKVNVIVAMSPLSSLQSNLSDLYRITAASHVQPGSSAEPRFTIYNNLLKLFYRSSGH